MLEVLNNTLRDVNEAANEPVVLSATDFAWTTALLAETYRTWVLKRLSDVVRLRAGEGEPLRVQGLAAIAFLLINRNTDSARPLRRNLSPQFFQEIDSAIAQTCQAFADVLSPTEKDRRLDSYSLYSGFALTEAQRRLGPTLSIGDSIYLTDEEASLDRWLSELRRRPAEETIRAPRAFDELTREYRRIRPLLASHRMAYERIGHTARLRDYMHELTESGEPG
ncbi:MAG: hypothetical protein ACJ74O_17850 [Frankiaceae bacterium]